MKEKINELFRNTKVNTILIRNFSSIHDPSFYYFTEQEYGSFSNNFLILKRGKKGKILTTPLEFGAIKNKNFSVRKFSSGEELIKLLRKELKGRVGLNYAVYPKGKFDALGKLQKSAKFTDVGRELRMVRAVKTAKEIRTIGKAAEITKKVLGQVPKFFRRGMSENELAIEIEYRFRKRGAQGVAFPTIVASGKGASVPHYISSAGRKIGKGVLLVDCGARYKNYCADITRMFYVGKPSEREMNLYSEVFNAKKEAEAHIREGVSASEIHDAAENYLEKNLKMKMPHALGHGLGIEAHDAPGSVGKRTDWKLQENMVITVEPGVYWKSGGIRIEDDVVVRKNGLKRLSNAPQKFIQI